MKIVGLNIKRKYARINTSFLVVKVDEGIKSDTKASSINPTIPTLDINSRDMINKDKLVGLCYKRFIESVSYSGDSILERNRKIKINNGLFEVTSDIKRCFNECKLLKSNEICYLKSNVRYIKPLSDCVIHIGDDIVYVD